MGGGSFFSPSPFSFGGFLRIEHKLRDLSLRIADKEAKVATISPEAIEKWKEVDDFFANIISWDRGFKIVSSDPDKDECVLCINKDTLDEKILVSVDGSFYIKRKTDRGRSYVATIVETKDEERTFLITLKGVREYEPA